ncbi:hypothetical protein SAMN02787073_2831 [Chryseobacterium vrystaatense]|uniref:Four helix bundle protein n=1 Tax=Chryseobacterium vrystaatense TaxID=307480 RepID=A0A1M5E6S9_9FLAO|nr:hypothetical protein SAMN02787073_2831 [Chryseobacterium vrystaatense]
MALVKEVCLVSAQIRRCAVSLPSNISEAKIVPLKELLAEIQKMIYSLKESLKL